MAFQIGQPGESAFLQSLLRDLDVVIKMGDFLFQPVNTELKKVKKLLLGFEDLLLDGERKRMQLGNKGAKRWMDDIKDLFYDIDDLLDEVKMEKHQLQPEIKGQPSHSDQVRYNHDLGFPTQKNIKNRLGQVLDILGERTKEADRLLKRDDVQHDAIWVESQANIRQKPGCYADEAVTHGREKEKQEIIGMLLANDGGERRRNYEVICVVGMGGLGKTTLAQLVFQDESVKRSFAVRSWTCVSDVFDVIKVTQDLIESAGKGYREAKVSGLSALQARLEEIINGQKFLLVLDDVWTENVLNDLRGPLNRGAIGSKILVTTRLNKVAEELGNKEPYRLGILEYAHCLTIFNDNAFAEDGFHNDRCLVKMGEEIVRKCRGVPLVAKVIGAMLRGKNEFGEWKAVKEHGIWDLAYGVEDLHPGLRLSYFYLPPFLKRCFEYFALFPTDFQFDKSKLVRLWMAEGLIEVKDGRQPEEIGNQYYNDLKGRSLIQEDNKMHDMVHHLACIVSGGSFLCGFSGSSSSTPSPQSARHAFTREVPIDVNKLRTLIHDGEFDEKLFSCKRLRVLEARTLSDLPSTLGYDLKYLRFLKFKGMYLFSVNGLDNLRDHDITDLPDSIFTLTNLQVLDVSYCSGTRQLPQDVGKLLSLRFLRLQHSSITVLPDSVCSLYNLRVLDLSYCKCLKTLPKDVGDLRNLRELILDGTTISSLPDSIVNATNLRVLKFEKSVALPAHIGKLTKLEQLSYYKVDKEKGRGIEELKDMNMIDTLNIPNMENIESAEMALMANLRNKKHMENLEFDWRYSDTALTGSNGEMEVRVMDALEPNAATIKNMTIRNYVGYKLPSWMSSAPMHNLTELKLFRLTSTTELTAKEFKSLRFISLEECLALRKVSMTTPKLCKLIVNDCKELRVLELSHCLEELMISDCPILRNLPYGLHDLASLQTIALSNCPRLEIRPNEPLPPSIKQKWIVGCPKIGQVSKWNWPTLRIHVPALTYLNMMSFCICLITIYLLYFNFSCT